MKDSSATAAPPLIRRTIRKAKLPPLIDLVGDVGDLIVRSFGEKSAAWMGDQLVRLRLSKN
jgi:hypothetical protein